MYGYVHSFESLAAVDGEGLRCAVFLSGCPMRCVYCHNPDTWCMESAGKMHPEALADKIARYKPYFGKNGGATFSGGEPLCQANFINETAGLLNKREISYALDTSGSVPLTDDVKTALCNSAFVILDLKFWDDESYMDYTGLSIQNTLATLDYLESIQKRVWMRTVIVPGINDRTDILDRYLALIEGKTCIERYELLAFHTMGFFKYENLGISNPLIDKAALSAESRSALQDYVDKQLNKKYFQ